MIRENLLSPQPRYTNLLGALPENNFLVKKTTELDYGLLWHVVPTSTPRIIRKCSRCDRDRFHSSDKFRVNANKKLIDVWLIYKCVHCDATLNLLIINRRPITKIEADLLNCLQSNDTALCWQYAFSSNLFQKGIKMDWDIDIVVKTEILDNPIVCKALDKIQIQIKSQYNLKIPIFSVLRVKMQMSRAQLEKLQKKQALEIFNLNGEPLVLKNSLGSGCILVVSNLLQI
ncbi:MAG TPA: DUF1062 domain-containing protein [Gammaproteobacteria bacterium]|nr:DUF1062 domain-containing protein [Gammaproteobacteria bacterium]